MRFVQFDSKIPASVFITLDQYVSIKYFEPKISKNFKIDVETKFITLKNPNSVYLQFVCSDYSGKRGYTFYALTENETKNSVIDKIRLKNLKKQIHSENKGKVLFFRGFKEVEILIFDQQHQLPLNREYRKTENFCTSLVSKKNPVIFSKMSRKRTPKRISIS